MFIKPDIIITQPTLIVYIAYSAFVLFHGFAILSGLARLVLKYFTCNKGLTSVMNIWHLRTCISTKNKLQLLGKHWRYQRINQKP